MTNQSFKEKFPDWQVDIGMEVHVQLSTNSKIFCACPNKISIAAPNKNICPVCTGQPGVLPLLNKQVVNYAIQAALATNSNIALNSTFDRKHYFYPDLPKNFQITQNFQPICTDGHVPIRLSDGTTKKIRLIRIHMEEDAGKNIHGAQDESYVDLNRAGTPLLEIVSYPDISSADEAKAYLQTLRSIVMYLGICSGNMEEGAFRADTNISVRKKGAAQLGKKVELKNINSFKFIYDAIEHEIERQITQIEAGEPIRQETRLWDTKERVTVLMRVKEELADYRYFPEPDILPVIIDDAQIKTIQTNLPELPDKKYERFVSTIGLSPYEADILVTDKELADYFDAAYAITKSKQLINWILRDLLSYIKEAKISISECKVTPMRLAQLIDLIEKGTINNRTAAELFAIIAQTGQEPAQLVKEKGLEQIGSTEEIAAIVKEIIAANPNQVAQYKAGNEKLIGYFVGQAMQKTAGKANPKIVQEIIKKQLA
jgi:aspartyl-tRNA(Asn)/glutamyl-tRNA(Gln) amidotransferase subunit B